MKDVVADCEGDGLLDGLPLDDGLPETYVGRKGSIKEVNWSRKWTGMNGISRVLTARYMAGKALLEREVHNIKFHNRHICSFPLLLLAKVTTQLDKGG